MKCDYCMKDVSPDCDWQQGRCPYRPSMVDQILLDKYKTRYYNLIQTIKGWFK